MKDKTDRVLPRHVHRYCWGDPEWLRKWMGRWDAPPEPHTHCRCGKSNPVLQ